MTQTPIVRIYAHYGETKKLAFVGFLDRAAERQHISQSEMLAVARKNGAVRQPADSKWPPATRYYATEG